jgi:hypothetical protein
MHRKISIWISLLIFSFLITASLSSINAQGPDVIDPMQLSDTILKLQHDVRPTGPPTVEMLSDDRLAFSLEVSGEVSGDLQGSITARISEVHPVPALPRQSFTSMFVIETEAGRIEGFYTGVLYRPESADAAEVHGEGRILSVSGVYADLYLASIFVQSTVPYQDGVGIGENGSMVIAPQ